MHDARRKAGLCTEANQLVVEGRAELPAEEDERLGAKRGECQAAAGGQSVRCRQDRNHRLFEDDAGGERSGGPGFAQEPEIDLVTARGVFNRAGGQLAQRELNLGKEAAIFPDGGGQRGEQNRGRCADSQLPGFAAAGAAGRVDGALHLGQKAARFFPESGAGVGERRLSAALKEAAAEPGFEFLNLLRERRLGDPDAFGSPAEVQFFGYGEEVAELAEIRRVHMKIISIDRFLRIGHITGRSPTLGDMSDRYLLPLYERYPLTVESGRGCYLFDADGRRYLDMISGIGVNAFGYAHPRITAALVEQAGLCVHTSNLVQHRYQGELAERLCRMSGLDRAFFSNSGAEAMEAALKAARARGLSMTPRKTRLVALRGSFHGRSHGALAVTGQPELRRPFEPLGAAVTFVDPNDCDGLAAAVGEDTAALIVEPVLGEGGIYPLDAVYLRHARAVTERAGALLVVDETQCGLGRTGRHFAYQWAEIRPDLVVTAKPLAGGLPLGATLFTEEAAQWLPVHSHGSTFGGGPLACRVALECLCLLEEVLPRIGEIAAHFRARLEELQSRHPAITEIRSHGLMFGIQLDRPGRPYVLAALERGLLMNCTQGNVLRLLPPYIAGREEIEETMELLDAVLSGQKLENVPSVTGFSAGF